MTKYKEGDVLEVVWVDPTVTSGWDIPQVARSFTPLRCSAVGHFVKSNNPKFINLALLADAEGRFSNVFSVPLAHVDKIRRLRKRDE